MFSKEFFKDEFPSLANKYAEENKCTFPIVEFQLLNGDAFLAKSINNVTKDVIVINCYQNKDVMTQTICSINNISKVNFYKETPESYKYDKHKECGFRVEKL